MPSIAAAQIFLHGEFLSISNATRLDEAVNEVFARMLGLSAEAVEPTSFAPSGNVRTAIVGFSGAMRGCCEVHLAEPATVTIATAMLGGVPVEDAESLDDTAGELCNMIAGGWKDRLSDLSASCSLSPPTVITGRDFKVHISRPSEKLVRCYGFNGQLLCVTLHRESSPA